MKFAMIKTKKPLTVYEFEDPQIEDQWRSINDTVMGGVSYSRLLIDKRGFAVFFGVVSLENNGGFASVRSFPKHYDLSDYEGLAIRVKGDGKRYKLSLKTEDRLDGVVYQQSFETFEDRWKKIYLPFCDFKPGFRGRLLENAKPLNPSEIRTFGFVIAEKQDGVFQLNIDWIKAYQMENTQF